MAGSTGGLLGTLFILVKTRGELSGLNKTDKALKRTAQTARSMSSSIGNIGKLAKLAFGGALFYQARNMFNGYLQFEKDLGAMKSRFYAITKDETKAQEEFNYIRKLAIDTANDIKTTADSYSIFYASARRALGQENARGIFEEWTKISRVLHLSEAQFERVTYALREMSSKGQLYSQDLKIQLGTHVPDAINIAESAIKSLGIQGVETVDEFQKLTKRDPKAGWMSKFLVAFSKEAGRRYASPEALQKAMQQPDALVGQIRGIFQEFLIKFSEKGGNKAIITILTGVKDALLQINFEALANNIGGIAIFVSKIFNHLPQIINLLKIIAGFVALRFLTKNLAKLSVGLGVFERFVSVMTKRYIKNPFDIIMYKKLFTAMFKSAIINKLMKSLTGFGFKTVAKYGLRFIPVLGTISTLLFTIIELIKLFIPKKNKSDLNNGILGNTGIPIEKVISLARELNKNGIKSSYEANEAFRRAGLGEATKYLRYDMKDERKIYISIDGSKYSPDEIANKIAEKIEKDRYIPSRPSNELLKDLYKDRYGVK